MLLLLLQLPCTTRIMIWGQWHKSLAAKEQARERGLSIQEADHCLDAELFLAEYLQWEVGGPYCSIILQRMFIYTPEAGQKEAERFIHWGHWHGLPRLNPEADVPAIKLVGYWTSQKEIWDLYHEAYLLKRLPSLLPCGPKWMEEATKDILSSLRSHLQRWGGRAMLEEGHRGAAMASPWPSCQTESCSWSWGRDYSHNEALWEAREAHQWALEATHMLELNIDRLTKEADGDQCQCPHSHSCHGVGLWIGMRGLWAGIDWRDMWPFMTWRNVLGPKAPQRIPRAFNQRTTGDAM